MDGGHGLEAAIKAAQAVPWSPSAGNRLRRKGCFRVAVNGYGSASFGCSVTSAKNARGAIVGGGAANLYQVQTISSGVPYETVTGGTR